MRINLHVKQDKELGVCMSETLLVFCDKNDKKYYWFTRSVSPILLIAKNEWIDISAKIKGYNSDGVPILKNVRIIKPEKIYYNIVFNREYKGGGGCFNIKEGKSKFKSAYYSTTDKKEAEEFKNYLNSD